MNPLGTFILDFQTQSINFESDFTIATSILEHYQKSCNFGDKESFAFDPPMTSAGWSFSKLFLAGQFVEKIYENNLDEVDRSKGKRFEHKFVSWLNAIIRKDKCQARLKISTEMSR